MKDAMLEEKVLALPPEERARLADKLWASVADDPSFSVVMTPELERLLDEGIVGIERAKPTSELRAGSERGNRTANETLHQLSYTPDGDASRCWQAV